MTVFSFAAEINSGDIVIMHTNDVHGAISQYPKLAALKDDYEKQGAYVLLFDAGDYIQGEPYVSLSKGETAIELMGLTGYDAAIPGNHEFDYGIDNFIDIAEKATFTVLGPVNATYNGSGIFNENAVFTAPDGRKIGVFGVLTPNTSTSAHPGKIKGVSFLSEEALYKSVQQQVDKLEALNCDIIVCLSHLGIEESLLLNRSVDLLEKVEGIDLLIDGHSHSTVEDIAALVGDDMKVGDSYITSTGTKLASVGVVKINVSGEMSIEGVASESLTDEEPTTSKRVAEIQKQIEDDYGTVFAVSEVLLNGERSPGNRTEETNLGDLVCDAMIWGAKQNGEEVDAAINNGGGIRAPVNAGAVTKKDINTVLPFGNTLCIIEISGKELLEALEASTYVTPEPSGSFPQTAGIEFQIDTAKAYDKGAQYAESGYFVPNSIQRVSVKSVGGKPFDANAVYKIATNDFLAAGGDSYFSFKASNINYDLGIPLDEVVIDYIYSELDGVIINERYGMPQGRIKVLSAEVGERYIVKDGDCLWNIAVKIYGDGCRWKDIYNANKSTVADVNIIYTGQELILPSA